MKYNKQQEKRKEENLTIKGKYGEKTRYKNKATWNNKNM